MLRDGQPGFLRVGELEVVNAQDELVELWGGVFGAVMMLRRVWVVEEHGIEDQVTPRVLGWKRLDR